MKFPNFREMISEPNGPISFGRCLSCFNAVVYSIWASVQIHHTGVIPDLKQGAEFVAAPYIANKGITKAAEGVSGVITALKDKIASKPIVELNAETEDPKA